MSKRKFSLIRLKDLSSTVSFEAWVKKNTNKYRKDKKIPRTDLEKYIGFIRSRLSREIGKNKSEWLKSLKKIQERLSDESK